MVSEPRGMVVDTESAVGVQRRSNPTAGISTPARFGRFGLAVAAVAGRTEVWGSRRSNRDGRGLDRPRKVQRLGTNHSPPPFGFRLLSAIFGVFAGQNLCWTRACPRWTRAFARAFHVLFRFRDRVSGSSGIEHFHQPDTHNPQPQTQRLHGMLAPFEDLVGPRRARGPPARLQATGRAPPAQRARTERTARRRTVYPRGCVAPASDRTDPSP